MAKLTFVAVKGMCVSSQHRLVWQSVRKPGSRTGGRPATPSHMALTDWTDAQTRSAFLHILI